MRYSAASLSGTVVDIGSLVLLVSTGVPAGVGAAIGYIMGTLVHWIISSRIVFPDRLANPGLRRGGQQFLFVVSALLGLGLTTFVVSTATAQGAHLLAAKLGAMVVSFMTVWLVRLKVVFRPG